MAHHSKVPLAKELAEVHGPEVPHLDRSLWSMFAQTAAEHPQEEAVISLWQAPFDKASSEEAKVGIRWTYSELLERVEALAAWLEEQGCTKGQRLVALVWNSVEWALFLWVAARLQLPFVPVDPRDPAKDGDMYIELANPYVLVVQDEAVAAGLEKSPPKLYKNSQVRIVCSKTSKDMDSSWNSLPELLPALVQNGRVSSTSSGDEPGAGDDIAMIVFTSGTTSQPKGCIYTASNLWSQSFNYDQVAKKNGRHHVTLIHTPVWHSFAVNQALRGWREGWAIVVPAARFDITASLRALEEEHVTYMAAVPPLVYGLAAHPKFPGKEKLNLAYVSMGGTLIKEQDIAFCKDKLGSDAVVQAFGLTEGIPVASWIRNDPLLKNDFHPGVGKVLPGSKLRICAPGTRSPLKRDDTGELHISGSSVIKRYLNNASADAFYEDDAGRWFATGDQGRIDEDGALYINGRYKDIIIRAGQNLAPGKVELCLQQHCGVAAQVIGVPDSVAGEVPMAVLQSRPASLTDAQIAQAVKEHAGIEYVLEDVVTLEQLGLKAFPVTALGKVQKNVLKQTVMKYLGLDVASESQPKDNDQVTENGVAKPHVNGHARNEETTQNAKRPDSAVDGISESQKVLPPKTQILPENLSREAGESGSAQTKSDIVEKLQAIWAKLLNIPTDEISPSTSMLEVADSVSILRFCDRVWRQLGRKLYLQDFKDAHTIEQQAQVLLSRGEKALDATQHAGFGLETVDYGVSNRTGPPNINDIVLSNGDEERFQDIVRAAESVLSPLSLTWQDVEDVVPIKDTFYDLARGQRPQTWRHRIAFEVRDYSARRVRAALQKGLSTRPMFRALLATLPDKTLAHVVVRPSAEFFDRLVTSSFFDSKDSFQAALLDDSPDIFSDTRMFQVTIGPIQETGTTGLVMTYNHSVFDALTSLSWYSDLDRLLLDLGAQPTPQTPFKWWADLTFETSAGYAARKSVNYFVKRLKGASEAKGAVWPPQQSVGWMVGSEEGSSVFDARVELRKKHGHPRVPLPRIWTTRRIPHLRTVQTRAGVSASIVAKAAVTLFNMEQTGQRTALFSSTDAGRNWPGVPAWIANRLPPAMSIDGPTLSWTPNVVRVGEKDTVASFLQLMKDEQDGATAHCAAPWHQVLESLGEEGPPLADAMKRQMFNWDLSLRYIKGDINDYTAMTHVGRMDWPDCGVFWSCGMVGTEELGVVITFDDAQLTADEVKSHIARVAKIAEWLVEPANMGQHVSLAANGAYASRR